MLSLDNIVLPNFLASKLAILSNYGVEFGAFVASIGGGFYTPVWIVAGFILVLMFKNSIQKLLAFNPNIKNLAFITFILVIGLLAITIESEFLYFNF